MERFFSTCPGTACILAGKLWSFGSCLSSVGWSSGAFGREDDFSEDDFSAPSGTTEQLHFHFSLSCIGEGNGNPLQCSCLEIPGTGEPGGPPSMWSHRVRHDWSDLATAAAVGWYLTPKVGLSACVCDTLMSKSHVLDTSDSWNAPNQSTQEC